MSKESDVLIGYAIGTERDAINMYEFMIKRLPPEYAPVLKHILKEEKEHAIELKRLLRGDFKVSKIT
jgi:rubrerythrin